MIFITARFRIKPEHADAWPEISREFTESTRAEPGCLWFDWARALDDSDEYFLTEAFADDEAGAAHVQTRALQDRHDRAAGVPAGDPAHHQLHRARHGVVRARRDARRLTCW